jgi:hypothetical protein
VNAFKKLNKNPNKEIFHQITCATDTQNIKKVFDAARLIVLRKAMQQMDLMD